MKLNIQRFASSGRLVTNGDEATTFYLNWSIASQNIASNQTIINWDAGVTLSNNYYFRANAVRIDGIDINGQHVTDGGSFGYISGNGDHGLLSGQATIPHNDDGTKTFNIRMVGWTIGDNNFIGSQDFTLDAIPRYANITSFYCISSTETSASFNWGANVSCDAVQYSLNNGNWIDTYNTSFTIYGLNANTSYSLKIRVKRQDSQLWTESNTIQFSTYEYPYVTSISDITIGNEISVNIYNPLGRTYKLELIDIGGDVLGHYNGSINGNVTGFNDKSTIDNFYKHVPNSMTGTLYARVTYGNIIKQSGNVTYRVKGTELPTFTTDNWGYTSDLIELTNNDKTIINNYSTLTIKINKEATPYDAYTSIEKYIVKVGDNSQEITDISKSVQLKASGKNIQVSAIDSRGLMTTTTYSIPDDNYIDYTIPNIDRISADRTDGVGEDAFITMSIILYNKFGNEGVDNSILSAEYYVSTTNKEEDYKKVADIDTDNFTYMSGKYRLDKYQIFSDTNSAGFTINKKYYIKIIVKDKLDNGISYTIVKEGIFAREVFKDNNGYHEGINGLANNKYTQDIHGGLNAEEYYKNGEILGVVKEFSELASVGYVLFTNGLLIQYGYIQPSEFTVTSDNKKYQCVHKMDKKYVYYQVLVSVRDINPSCFYQVGAFPTGNDSFTANIQYQDRIENVSLAYLCIGKAR